MNELDLLLRIMTAANAATPTIVGIINTIKQGRAAGLTDEEIQAESMRLALETREITEEDMGDQS